MNINKISFLKKEGINFSILKKAYELIGLNKKKLNITLKLNKKNIFNKILSVFTYNETLKNKIEKQIFYYKNIKNYRGMRHIYKYPVRGQRTHTNAKTQKKLKLLHINQN